MPAPVHILILAAGSASRMRGTDKLMETVDGAPLLVGQVRMALATGAPVTVALSPAFPARQAALRGLPCRIARVPDAAKGMSASLRRGMMAIRAQYPGKTAGVMILPADMPLFTSAALAGMIASFAARPDHILRGATDQGQAGHPAMFPRAFWPELESIRGDEGGRSVIAAHADRVVPYPLPGLMATFDLDTPEDWTAWRALPRA
jgi:molybdenum cofactor cytidylyltransferase